jgi:DNA-binding response OmpR family regulator
VQELYPDTLFFLVTCLADAGYQVLSARNGQEALQYLAAERPGLILLDLVLPDLDGGTILQHLQQAHITVPVILISGAPVAQVRLQRQHPAVAFVPKPIDLDALLARVDQTLALAATG